MDNNQSLSNTATTTDLVYAEMLNRVAIQDAQIAALDAKASVGLGAATLVSAAIAIQQIIWGGDVNLAKWAFVLSAGATTAAFLTYLAVVFSTFLAYSVREFEVTPDPKRVECEIVPEGLARAKEILYQSRVEALIANEPAIRDKARWTKRLHRFLLSESLALFLLAVAVTFGRS